MFINISSDCNSICTSLFHVSPDHKFRRIRLCVLDVKPCMKKPFSGIVAFGGLE